MYPEEISTYISLLWCVEGEITFHCETRDLRVPAGSACILTPMTRFSTSCKGKRTEFWYIALDGSSAEDALAELGLWEGVFPYLNVPYKWLNHLASEVKNIDKQNTIAMLGKGLFETFRHDLDTVMTDKMVWMALQILHKEWNNPELSVNYLAARLDVTRATLSNRFKKFTRSNIQEYLDGIRYRRALIMLRMTMDSCSDIARSCGFEDPAYFSRWFKKMCGISPSSFRK